ncbi:MAG: PAS domain S-box protein [Alphaproteobacteria bacterium]|nr:PAS domain S-box protein [Alphaproteobacteria bacterium]
MPRFVVVIVGAFMAAVTVFAVLEMVIARKAQESGNFESARRVLASALELGRHTIEQDAGALAAAAHGVMNEPGARDAFVRRDIDVLSQRIGPIFERLKAMQQVSALSLRAADGTILFRAHAPGRRGGGPLHASYWRASESRMPAAGLEITEGGGGVGVSVVSPWLDDQGTLLGFVEMMRDFGGHAGHLRQILGVESLILLDRAAAGEDAWREAKPEHRLDRQVVAGGSISLTPAQLSDILARPKDDVALVDLPGAEWFSLWLPLTDLQDRPLGGMLAFVQPAAKGFTRAGVTQTLLLLVSAGGMLTVLFYLLAARVDRELRRSQGDLARGEERYALAMEAAAEGLYDWDIASGSLYVSPRVQEIFGFPTEKLRTNLDWLAHVLPEDAGKYRDAAIAYFKGRDETLSCEYRIVDSAGEIRWIQERSLGARDKSGQVTRLVGSIGDVTELKRAESALMEAHRDLEQRVTERTMMLHQTTQALKQREERLRAIMNAVIDGIITTDERGVIETVNPAVEEIFGYPAAEVVGQNVTMLMAHEDAARHDGYLANHTSDRPSVIGVGRELVGRRKDGATFPLEIALSEVNLGKQRLFIGVVRDITRRKQGEQALRESERRFRNIFEQSVEGIFQTSPDGAYIEANPALAALYGYSSPEEMKTQITDIGQQIYVDPRARDEFKRRINSEGIIRDAEYQLRRRDGGAVWVLENCWAVRDTDGTLLYYEGTVQDITERKRAEREIAEKQALLHATLENITQGVAIFDRDRRLLGGNNLFERMLGLAPQLTRLGTALSDLVTFFRARGDAVGDDSPEALMAEGQPHDPPKGERVLPGGLVVQVVARHIADERMLITYTDVTDLKQHEAELRRSEERYALAARGANDGLWDWDLDHAAVYYSPRWKTMLGCSDEELGSSPEEWFGRVHPDDLDELKAAIETHLSGATTHVEVEFRIRHSDGRYRWMLTRGLAVFDPVAGRALRIAGSQTDITERKRAEQQLLYDAFHDGLTGLPNRALFMDRLGQAVSRSKRSTDRTFAVLFLDVDRFKYVNDSLGHSAGDGLIVALARRITACRRASDTVARLGGDEFAVLLEDVTSLADAVAVADQVQKAISTPLSLRGQEVFPSASMGIAWGTSEYDRAEDVLSDADVAMYRAKAAGKSRHEIFEKSMRVHSIMKLGLETDLRRAFERNEMVLFYQPIMKLETGRIAGFEALMRWRHAQRGLVSPAEFIPLAEETGLIVQLGWWAMQEACRQMQTWNERFPHEEKLFMSVNVSARQFKDPDLIDNIAALFRDTGFDPRCVKLEITESLLMDNPAVAADWLKRLKALDLSLAIDDFGTGYSSLSYLHRFPFDTLKVDRSFVSTMVANRGNLEIVRAIVDLSHTLGMKVVAEGAERAEESDLLRALGCDFVQGYYFGRPVPSEEIETMLAKLGVKEIEAAPV